jgi:DNA-binding response OmpR family regulator
LSNSGAPREGSAFTLELYSPVQLELEFSEKPKILIVDDDRDTLEMLSIFFMTHGYSVAVAPTGKAALDAIQTAPGFDVVLLDVFIPDVGGMEVLTEIKKLNSPPGVILLTALADREIAHDALRLGAFDYILKPSDLIQLESTVVACLGHNEYQKQSWWRRFAS